MLIGRLVVRVTENRGVLIGRLGVRVTAQGVLIGQLPRQDADGALNLLVLLGALRQVDGSCTSTAASIPRRHATPNASLALLITPPSSLSAALVGGSIRGKRARHKRYGRAWKYQPVRAHEWYGTSQLGWYGTSQLGCAKKRAANAGRASSTERRFRRLTRPL